MPQVASDIDSFLTAADAAAALAAIGAAASADLGTAAAENVGYFATAAQGTKADAAAAHNGLFSDAEIPGCTLDIDASILTLADGANVASITSLDADATVITGGAGVNPTFSAYGINGIPAIKFNGTNQYMSAVNFFTNTDHSAMTCFVVMQADKVPNESAFPIVMGATWPNFYIRNAGQGTGTAQFFGASWNNNILYNGPAIRTEDPIIFTCAQGTGPNGFSAWISDVKAANEDYSAAACSVTGPLFIGNNSALTSIYYYSGLISRIILFNRRLTDAETLKIQSGLVARYKMGKQSIILDGDSITVAVASSLNKTLSYYVGRDFPDYEVINNALGGRNSASRLANAAKWAKNVRDGREIVCYAIGTNDINIAAADLEALKANVQSYCALMRKNKRRVIVGTLVSMKVASYDQDAQREVYNVWLRANWKTFADGLVDYGAIPEVGAMGAYSNTTYFLADGVHPIGPGYDLMGPALVNAIKELIGEPIAPRAIASGTATILPTDSTIVVTGTTGATLALPLATTVRPGKPFVVKDGGGNAGASNITITGTIDGGTNKVISTNSAAVTLFSDGTNWLTR